MHVHHELLVKAETAEDAKNEVEEFLEGESWSDWHEIGGRWDRGEQNIICYKGNEKEVKERIEHQFKAQIKDLTWNKEELARLLKTENQTIDSLPAYCEHESYGDLGMIGHYLYSIGEIVAGYYSSSSFFYDVDYGSPRMTKEQWERLEKEPEKFWLVTVDIHH